MVDDKNFIEYESHIDSLINQYKSQLESIKNNRQSKSNEKLLLDKDKLERIETDKGIDFSLFIEESFLINKKNDKKFNSSSGSPMSISKKLITHSSNNTNSEENIKLNKQINQLKETNEDYESKCDKLQNEINFLILSELELKNDKEKLNNSIKDLEKSIQRSEDEKEKFKNTIKDLEKNIQGLEKKISDDEVKFENHLKDVDNYYEDIIREKEQEMDLLDKKFNENNLIIQKLISFLRKHSKYICENSSDFISENKNYSFNDFNSFLDSMEIFIQKIMQDNTELVNHLNKLNNRNESEVDSVRLNKLNSLIDDLKLENSSLKSQLNNLMVIDSNKEKKTNRDSSLNIKKKKVNSMSNNINTNNKHTNDSDYDSETEKIDYNMNIKKYKESFHRGISPVPVAIPNSQSKIISRQINENNILKNFCDNNLIYGKTFNNFNSNLPQTIGNNDGNNKQIKQTKEFHNSANSNPIPNVINSTNINSPNNINNNEKVIGEELIHFEKLKNKIKELECKIGEINKDEKEKKIIDSLRDFRNKNINVTNNKK